MSCRGVFFDPKHGGCLRRVCPSGPTRLVVRGVFGDDEAPARPGEPWTVYGEVVRTYPDGGCEIRFDFRTKRVRKKDSYRAWWKPRERVLEFDDRNQWRAMHWDWRTQMVRPW